MQLVARTGRPLLRTNAFIMLFLGVILSLLCGVMTNPTIERSSYLAAATLVSVGVLVSAMISHKGGLWSALKRRNDLRAYLSAMLPAIALGAIYWHTQAGAEPVHALTMLTAVLGIYWGMWLLGLALRLRDNSGRRNVLCVVAAVTSGLGLILATGLQFSEFGAVTAVACYATLLGVQGLAIVLYLHKADFDAEFGLKPGASA